MNPYMSKVPLNTVSFLETTYILLKKKVTRLIEIENSKKKNKLSLPLLKEKFESTSNILQAITELSKNIDYNKSESEELAGILNDLGIIISKGNLTDSKEEALKYYDTAIIILEAFLEEPQ